MHNLNANTCWLFSGVQAESVVRIIVIILLKCIDTHPSTKQRRRQVVTIAGRFLYEQHYTTLHGMPFRILCIHTRTDGGWRTSEGTLIK